jgi:hypothetical protein
MSQYLLRVTLFRTVLFGIHDSRKQCGPESHGCYNAFQISTNVCSTMATAHKTASMSKAATGALAIIRTR